ncbi:MAG: CPBP family intramembrane glutamic endopeptidase [Peptoniphilus sp.]|uniref:CPBP family intramembrane glutamic endopeptidase n=1 Tax=Peptoniphilus sp. TaxID=1971214 RepID=UPI002A74AE36|nr:CPBP family intramembrane glutamic endopeptidase [Peptoniphilus sp.]MDY2986290.1 CPBP family intramembrane glutamic endopeptidase [Peptoniphilus sp.]
MKINLNRRKYKKKNLNVLSVNTFTLLLSILFLLIGNYIQSKNFFRGTFINEIFIILIPALFIAGTGKFTHVLRIKYISLKNIFRVILMTILSYPIILLVNGLFLSIFSNITELNNFSMDVVTRDMNLSGYLFYMCLVPAICEEIFFRGALINSYDIYGPKFAIFMSALVFALFHFDIQNFLAPLLLGIMFGNFLELTGSIFACMIAHFVNNVIALISARYVNDSLFSYLQSTSLARDIGSLQLYIITLLIILSGISIFILKNMYRKMYFEKKREDEFYGRRQRIRAAQTFDFFNFVPIIALFILYFIYYKVVFY